MKNVAPLPETIEDEPPFKPLTAEEARKLREKHPLVSPWWVVAGQAVNDDEEATMNGYVVRSEGTKYGIGFGSALAIAISYTTSRSSGRSSTVFWAGCT